jgi:hypothetical protein
MLLFFLKHIIVKYFFIDTCMDISNQHFCIDGLLFRITALHLLPGLFLYYLLLRMWDKMFVSYVQDFVCRASLDSLLNPEDITPSLPSRGVLLHSAATTQSTMDYSTMAVDEGVVDSHSDREPILERESSPSPMWPRSTPMSPHSDRMLCNPTKRILYDRLEVDACATAHKVRCCTY